MTRSIGATAVLEIAAEMPPAAKSLMNATGSESPGMVGVVVLYDAREGEEIELEEVDGSDRLSNDSGGNHHDCTG